MKNKKTAYSLLFVVGLLLMNHSYANDLLLSFTDSAWTGDGIPVGQQCKRFKGENPQSPELVVKNIPEGTTAIIIEFSDRTFANMNNGGHGKVGFKIAMGATEVTIPQIDGHTEILPENFFIVANHRAPNWDTAGAYLPPCSGGRGNQYFIDVKAVKYSGDDVSDVLVEASIKMATY